MNDRIDVRPGLVDAGVEVKFQRRFALAFDDIAVESDGDDIPLGNLTALAGADIDQHAAIIKPDAGMAIVIHNARPLEHADTLHDPLLMLFNLGHGVVPCL